MVNLSEKDRTSIAVKKQISQSLDNFETDMQTELERTKLGALVSNKSEKFTYFWRSNAYFSQWHKCDFTGPGIMWNNLSYLEGLPEEVTFNCTEQFMMYHKAMLFLDREVAAQILAAKSPKEQKQLGRKVRNFHQDVWEHYRCGIVYRGNWEKFTQNAHLLETLNNTKRTTLVEASPYDRIWGVGLAEKDHRIQSRESWKGKNLLGEILTLLRVRLNDGTF